jgi:para-aminobenzoate synthetase/4-amino-4-deoxychorismate lyase
MPEAAPLVILDAGESGDFGRSWRFNGHIETLQAFNPGEVLPTLARVEQYAADGFYAAGFISYDAAAALNSDLASLPPREGLPLIWFAIYRQRHAPVHSGISTAELADPPRLAPEISPQDYGTGVARIKEYIANGDCYQANYTFGMQGAFQGDPLLLYQRIARASNASFSACIDTGSFAIISASPELFFSLQNGIITTRPMKGTARRGRWLEEDALLVAALKVSAKERAENLMIVDLLRNDLGIIARTGTVTVESLFDVETYPTLHQLTSTIAAQVREGIGLADIFRALFPCGSITGAPKRRSMEIINELEGEPRGAYCGAIGSVAPGGEALFSVAIRTLLYDRRRQTLSLGIGSGITTDSDAAKEYQECLTKAEFFFHNSAEFGLIESLRLENGAYPLLQRHLQRLASSAAFFGFSLDLARVTTELAQQAAGSSGLQKVRLLLARDGAVALTAAPLPDSDTPVTVAISTTRIDSADPFRYHKTTRRELLDAAREERADIAEVLFLNQRGELTEGSYHNLLLRIDGKLLTPQRESGLLAGVMRQELLERGETVEAILYPDDLRRAEEVWLINSVRGRRRAVLKVEGESW